jgi:HEAT repeat protein
VGFLRRFLAHPEPDVIASAIEASAELGDPEIVADLEKLVGDRREVTLDEAGDEDALTTTLGALAEETIEELELGFEGGED